MKAQGKQIKLLTELKNKAMEKETQKETLRRLFVDQMIQTFGEAAPMNNQNSYPVAMAEKRAMSRAVLKLAGFYQLGVFSEDESDDFKRQ